MLIVKAGPAALRWLREEGLQREGIDLLLGASGGPKWLVLSALDRFLAGRWLPASGRPVHLLGSSSGAWRFACYGQADPVAALLRLQEAYIEETYQPTSESVTRGARRILGHFLPERAGWEVLSHPSLRTHVVACRMRGPLRFEQPAVQGAGLLAAAACNRVHRRTLGWWMERAVFSDPRDDLPAELDDLPTRIVRLSPFNLADAVLASGSIPLWLKGVVDPPGAPGGVYRDGGLTDYHFDLPTRGFVLYPHFTTRLAPGWFDRFGRRQPRRKSLERMILLHPSERFLASLPGGRIPDRDDYRRFGDRERIARWRVAVKAGELLAESFAGWLEKPERLRVEPL